MVCLCMDNRACAWVYEYMCLYVSTTGNPLMFATKPAQMAVGYFSYKKGNLLCGCENNWKFQIAGSLWLADLIGIS